MSFGFLESQMPRFKYQIFLGEVLKVFAFSSSQTPLNLLHNRLIGLTNWL